MSGSESTRSTGQTGATASRAPETTKLDGVEVTGRQSSGGRNDRGSDDDRLNERIPSWNGNNEIDS